MAGIWFNKISLSDLQTACEGTLAGLIGIEFTEAGDNFLKATMPVDSRTQQPYGILHGGASVALAETLGSVAASLVLDPEVSICVGLEINANHVRAVRQGKVTGIASPLHIGATTHVWDIKIYDEREKLVCVSRITMAILKKKTLKAV
ncbi:MAG: hotdog fold thioesterase [Chitinophagaceae bacterium]|nr:hotdog fold thioesterase [Chitinophagaceae bacterium]